jgi:hypothetical protein
LVPQSLFPTYRILAMLHVVVMASRPFFWVYQPFDRHHISSSTPSSLCESSAMIVLCAIPSTWYICLRNVLLLFPHGILLKFSVFHVLTHISTKFYLRPFCISVLRSVDSLQPRLPSFSSTRCCINAVRCLFSITK